MQARPLVVGGVESEVARQGVIERARPITTGVVMSV